LLRLAAGITIGVVAFGWVLAGLGLVLAFFPRPLVVAARGWRLGAPDQATPGTLRAARAGALVAMVAGLVIALA